MMNYGYGINIHRCVSICISVMYTVILLCRNFVPDTAIEPKMLFAAIRYQDDESKTIVAVPIRHVHKLDVHNPNIN